MGKEFPFAWQSYESRVVPWSSQRLVNLYAEKGGGGEKTEIVLIGTPGLKEFTTVGEGPIRGQHKMGSVHFVISGDDVFTVNSSGIATNIGTIGGTDTPIMDDNGTQVAIASNGKGFIATTTSVVQITSPQFIGSVDSVTYIDSFFVWNSSEIMQSSSPFDGLTYNGLDIAAADYDPDGGVRVFRDHDQIFVFGVDSIEIWYNAAISSFPFAPIEGTSMEVGLKAKNSVAKVDNSIFWLGSDERGGLTVWRAIDYHPARISTHAIEKLIESATGTEDAIAFSYREEGHAFYVLTLPGQFTIVYDAATNLWHERETFNTDSWRVQNYLNVNGKNIVGDANTNQLFEMDLDALDDDGGTIERIATSIPIQGGDEYSTHFFVRVDFESGVGLTVGQGSDPQAMLSWSNDGGKTFNNEKFRSIGKIGEFRHRTYWRRLGQSRVRVYRLRVTDPVKIAIMGGFSNIRLDKW